MTIAVIDADLDGTLVGLRTGEDATIVALGPGVGARDGDTVIDAEGMALVAPLVNGHTHAAMTLFRGYGSDVQLQEWLSHYIWPAEARLTDDHVYWGTRLAAMEMLRTGTTSIFDMYWHPAAVARACHDAGIRAHVGGPLFDGGDATRLPALQDDARRWLDEIRGAPGHGDRIVESLSPHATYTVSEASLRWLAEFAREEDVLLHMHFCETVREVDDFLAAHDGLSPTVFLDRCGLLHDKMLLAHGCVMTPDDYALAAERGATIVTNPASNLKLASGRIFPYAVAAGAGVPIGLGTDGASSNNSLDLFGDLKWFALLQKHEAYDPTVLPAAEALAVAQGRRAPLLGGRPLAVGEPADFLLVRTDLPQMTPGNVLDNLVYAGAGEAVDTVVVGGTVLVRGHRVLPTADGVTEADILREARRCAAEILD